jgi:hypothetical protein
MARSNEAPSRVNIINEDNMAKRQKRVKLSKAQILENDTNKWQAKKSAAIDMLCKAMDKLRVLERRQGRVLKRVTITEPTLETKLPDDPRAYGLKRKPMHPVQKKIADKLNKATMAPDEAAELAQERGIEQEQRMKAMGFRKNKRTRSKTLF